MKSLMTYGANTYGNAVSAKAYTVKLTRSGRRDAIAITFDFASPAIGRGVGAAKGQVERVKLELPRETSEALSHALQLALADTASAEVEFKIEERE